MKTPWEPINPNDYQQRFGADAIANPPQDPMGNLDTLGATRQPDAFSGLDISDPASDQVSQPDPRLRAIQQMIAGDVVPMPAARVQDARDRMMSAIRSGSRGAEWTGDAGVRFMGGASNPKLDLLNVLQYPGGQSYGR
jgi:hypothetical protein